MIDLARSKRRFSHRRSSAKDKQKNCKILNYEKNAFDDEIGNCEKFSRRCVF